MEKGTVMVFHDEEYVVVENNIIEEKNKNKFMIVLNILAIVMFVVLFSLHMGLTPSNGGTITLDIYFLGIFVAIFIGFLVYVVIHEWLHGIAFRFFGGIDKSDLKFGVIVKSGMAYCISTVPVPVNGARISLMMPVIAFIFPMYIVALILGSNLLAFTTILYLTGSIADFYYIWKLRKSNKNQYMLEMMPTKTGYEIGYLLLEKK